MNNRGINYYVLLVLQWIPFVLLIGGLLLAPQYLEPFRLNQLGKFLTYAIIAIGLDLIWGYSGMMSLGQGLFFGLGAYGFAMYLKLQASGGKLPDFMFWSGLESLPWFWVPFQNPIFAVLAALVVPAIIAGVLGYLVFRSRVQGVYFSIITQALTLLTSIWFIGQQAYTGGTNGITNLGSAQLFGKSLLSAEVQTGFYIATVVCLALVYLIATRITNSRFGRMLIALRDNEARVRFLGYNPVMLKTLMFVTSAVFAALAGVLFVPQVGIISPSSMGVVPSIEMVIWVAVGGRGTLFGAIIGALVVSYARSFFSEAYPEIWQYFLGLLFVISVLFFKSGIVGTLLIGFNRLRVMLSGEPLEMSEHGLSFYRTAEPAPPAKSTAATTDSQRTEQVPSAAEGGS
ncbi:MAG: urea ABC transporter permease subunit UrtC [Caldilineaceae bacterium]|nr:urea ABC transporter permease subunit UrtC [Caldilineaceae bacterium]